MYYMSEEGSRVYTLAKTDPNGDPTFSAHPARYGITYTVLPFSPPKLVFNETTANYDPI